MKLSVPNLKLSTALFPLRSIALAKSPLFATEFLLFRQNSEGVSIAASEETNEMIQQLPDCSMDEPGQALVSASKLISISDNFDQDAVIAINFGEDKTEIDAGQSHFSLASLPAEQFPLMEWEKGAAELQIDVRSEDLLHLLNKVDFSMAQTDARYYLNGMLLANEDGYLVSVATDGHRLATCKIRHESEATQEARVILPRRAALELKRILSSVEEKERAEERVSVLVSDKHVRVRFGGATMTMKLVEGSNYPDYKRVMPSDFAHTISLDREEFKRTLAKSRVITGDTMRLAFSEGRLKAVSKTETDEAEVEQAAEYSGQPFEVGFNPQYLNDVMAVIETERVLLEFKDPNSAVQLRETDEENARYIVMPLRL